MSALPASANDLPSERIVNRLREAFSELLAVHAFGSRVRGDGDARSDLDLAVLVAGYADPLQLWAVSGELAELCGCDVDLLDLRAASTVMQHQILTRGQRWWARDVRAGLFEAAMLSEKTALDEARAALLADIQREGRVHAR